MDGNFAFLIVRCVHDWCFHFSNFHALRKSVQDVWYVVEIPIATATPSMLQWPVIWVYRYQNESFHCGEGISRLPYTGEIPIPKPRFAVESVPRVTNSSCNVSPLLPLCSPGPKYQPPVCFRKLELPLPPCHFHLGGLPPIDHLRLIGFSPKFRGVNGF